MNIIRKYTAIQVGYHVVNDVYEPYFFYGDIEYNPTISVTTPKTTFDTEQEAMEYAYKTSKYVKWLIVPIIEFN